MLYVEFQMPYSFNIYNLTFNIITGPESSSLGIPLFADSKEKIKLNLLSTRPFTCGVTELNYTVDRQ